MWRNDWHPVGKCLTTFDFLPWLKTLIVMHSYYWIVQNRTGIIIIYKLFTYNTHLMNKCADQVKSRISLQKVGPRFSTFVSKIQCPIPTLKTIFHETNNYYFRTIKWVCTQHTKNVKTKKKSSRKKRNIISQSVIGHLNPYLKFVENKIILIINFRGFIDMNKSVFNLWSRGKGLLHYCSIDVLRSATTNLRLPN